MIDHDDAGVEQEQSSREQAATEMKGRLSEQDNAAINNAYQGTECFRHAVQLASELVADERPVFDPKEEVPAGGNRRVNTGALLPWATEGEGGAAVTGAELMPIVAKALGANRDEYTEVSPRTNSHLKWNNTGPEALRVMQTAYPGLVLVEHVFVTPESGNPSRNTWTTRTRTLELARAEEPPPLVESTTPEAPAA